MCAPVTGEAFCERVRAVGTENFEVCGVRKVWRELRRREEPVARCTIAQLMGTMGLTGAVPGRTVVRMT